MRKHGSALELAGLLEDSPLKPGTYPTRCLLTGIESERHRLGSAPFLLVLRQDCRDWYDSMDFLFLLESFKSLNDATYGGETILQSISEERTTAGWGVESEAEPPSSSAPSSPPRQEGPLRTAWSKRGKLRGQPYFANHPSLTVERLHAEVIEGFTGPIVGKELLDFLRRGEDLRRYFIDCGEAVLEGKELPRPRQF